MEMLKPPSAKLRSELPTAKASIFTPSETCTVSKPK
jgi:hypothetical protein